MNLKTIAIRTRNDSDFIATAVKKVKEAVNADFLSKMTIIAGKETLNKRNYVADPVQFAALVHKSCPGCPDNFKEKVFKKAIENLCLEKYGVYYWHVFINKLTEFNIREVLPDFEDSLWAIVPNETIALVSLDVHIMEHLYKEHGEHEKKQIEDLFKALQEVKKMVDDNFIIENLEYYDFRDLLQKIHFMVDNSRDSLSQFIKISFFRNTTVTHTDIPRFFTHNLCIDQDLSELHEILTSKKFRNQHPIMQAATVYREIVDIQPFIDRNRSTALMFLNYYLFRGGFGPLIITPENREEFSALMWFLKEPKELADFIAENIKSNQTLQKKQAKNIGKLVSAKETLKNHVQVFQEVRQIYEKMLHELRNVALSHDSPVVLTAMGRTYKNFYKDTVLPLAQLSPGDKNYLDLSKFTFILTDEIEKTQETYNSFRQDFLERLPRFNRPKRVIYFNTNQEATKTIYAYKYAIDNLNINLALLGLGINGHLAYNEVLSSVMSDTRLVQLHPSTIKYHKFSRKQFAFTVGMKQIMSSERIIVASIDFTNKSCSIDEFSKRDSLKYAIQTTNVAGSYVRMHENKNFVFYADKYSGKSLSI